MSRESTTVTYLLTPKVESIERAADLLLAEMTSGMHIYLPVKG